MLMKSRLFEGTPSTEEAAAATAEAVVGEGVGFERIRRITGYLVGTLDRFNNAKRAEERDRVRHA
ncbi:anaerobic ribonucleoside-triphosphate reductase [uncultured Desulfovibrio sp.]|uniref:anaerobic ribonucleoside-triphosphate reductase n=1 Tax=uncultured Desulfovibrio sp. TaxID=167968 RepID=UPI0035A57821